MAPQFNGRNLVEFWGEKERGRLRRPLYIGVMSRLLQPKFVGGLYRDRSLL